MKRTSNLSIKSYYCKKCNKLVINETSLNYIYYERMCLYCYANQEYLKKIMQPTTKMTDDEFLNHVHSFKCRD